MNNDTENATDMEPPPSLSFLARSLSAKTTRNDHLEALLRSLDSAVFAFLGIVYCCDNLTPLLLLRAACQTLYTRSTKISPTTVANLICITTHILLDRPEGSKASRGYLHGGLICDFVGELGPISRTRLLVLDALVFGLQLAYVAISHELQELKDPETETTLPQDIEAEEAGVRREEQSLPNANIDDSSGIEMQPMLPGSKGLAAKATTQRKETEDVILTLDLRASLASVLKRIWPASPHNPTPMPAGSVHFSIASLLLERPLLQEREHEYQFAFS